MLAEQLSRDITTAGGLSTTRRRVAQILTTVSLLHLMAIGVFNYLSSPEAANTIVIGVGLFAVFYGTWFVLAQSGRVTIAATGLIVTLLIELALGGSSVLTASIILTVVVATLVQDTRLFYLYNLLMFSIVTVSVAQGNIFFEVSASSVDDIISEVALVVALLGVSITVRYFRAQIIQFYEDAEANAALLRIGSEVGQVTAGITDLDRLLPQAVDFIRDRFGYYHVQIFLLDEAGDVAVLRASTGEVGQILLERNHQLNVGSESVIGRVTLTGEPLNYSDTRAQGVHYQNELLPDTRAEIALPIRDGERIIGALDVQSKTPGAFKANQVQSLQIMANLLAASIRNALLFQQQQQNIQENQRLYIETQANLREIQRLNRQLTKESWDLFTTELGHASGVTVEGNVLTKDATWSQLLRQAGQTRQTVTGNGEGLTVAVPILLRGEVIGAMEVEPDDQLDENDIIEIVRAVSDRLAVSLDNARLFEESQETTLYEQRINQIVGQYQNATSVDELLQITLSELAETLGAEEGAIRLTSAASDSTEPPSPNGSNGHRLS